MKFKVANPEAKGIFHQDNIGVCLEPLKQGDSLTWEDSTFEVQDELKTGQNFLLKNMEKGGELITCGVVIGKLSQTLKAGSGLYQDGKLQLEEVEETRIKLEKRPAYQEVQGKRNFQGYAWENGQAGTENNVLILTTVECVNTLGQNLAALARQKYLKDYPNITSVHWVSAGSGCGMPMGEPREELKRILTQVMNHPNTNKILFLGLGCEQISIQEHFPDSQLSYFKQNVRDYSGRVKTELLQSYQSEAEALGSILHGSLKELLEEANKRTRTPCPLSLLSLGVKCGGSDRFSSLLANPVLGHCADRLVAEGGNVLITEIPEFEGVMPMMAARAVDQNLANWVERLIPRFDELSQNYPIASTGKQKIAPGNQAGHLINAKMKSAGAMLKAGSTALVGGLDYAESVEKSEKKGLHLVFSPSFDPISTTALALSGAQIVTFTTGLGTPIGSSLAQVVKLANRKQMGLSNQMDFFAEDILQGASIAEVGDQYFEFLIKIASGEVKTQASQADDELLALGAQSIHREFNVWKRWGDN